jgi:hypothetical protein
VKSRHFIYLFTYLLIAAPLLWLLGGLPWIEEMFPPRRPKHMPTTAIWIEAPRLPISWHHGWWFGCDMASSGTANSCRLVTSDGKQVYADEYLSCNTHLAIAENNLHLLPPPDSVEMWLFYWHNEGVAGFLSDGDLLLPVSLRDKCGEVRERWHLPRR